MLFIDIDTSYECAIYIVWIKCMDSSYDVLEWKRLIAIRTYTVYQVVYKLIKMPWRVK